MSTLGEQTLAIIKSQIKPSSYEKWFAAENAPRFEQRGDTVYIYVPDRYSKEALMLEELHGAVVRQALHAVIGHEVAVQVIDTSSESVPPQPSERRNNEALLINPHYTFDTFVVGASNRFAHAAAMAVAESPSRSYNPLFIYGDSGLGKTHLMHAICHTVTQRNPEKKAIYVSSETFTNQFISYLRENRIDQFKNHYRSADILLIDDIQFLVNKNQIQEEFFHTFNALHDVGKQIVISSDRHPKDINPLEERLRSRFAWGLITDIQPPDWETRCAILQQKALSENVAIDDDVIYYIAEKIQNNIRELEGALNRLISYAKVTGTINIDLEYARQTLHGTLPDNSVRLSIPLIQRVVAEHYQITVDDLKSKKKNRLVAYPRQVAMYLCRELLGATQPQIGRDFGDRDHSTVIHACEKIARERLSDQQLERSLKEIERQLQSH